MTASNLIGEIENIPVIDCHEHQGIATGATDLQPPNTQFSLFEERYLDPFLFDAKYGFPQEAIALLLRGYFRNDLQSAGASDDELNLLRDPNIATKEKWPLFERFWNKTKYTAYSFEIKHTLQRLTGLHDVNLNSLETLNTRIERVRDLDEFFRALNIKVGDYQPVLVESHRCKEFPQWTNYRDSKMLSNSDSLAFFSLPSGSESLSSR